MWRRLGAKVKEWRDALDFEADFARNRAKKEQLRQEMALLETMAKMKTEQTNQAMTESLAALQEALSQQGADALRTLEESKARLLATMPKEETVEQLRDRLKKMAAEQRRLVEKDTKRDKT